MSNKDTPAYENLFQSQRRRIEAFFQLDVFLNRIIPQMIQASPSPFIKERMPWLFLTNGTANTRMYSKSAVIIRGEDADFEVPILLKKEFVPNLEKGMPIRGYSCMIGQIVE